MKDIRHNQKRKRNILIISALDFWSLGEGKGGPALWRTLSGYAESGWNVCFITSNYIQENSSITHSNLYVIRFDSLLLKRLMKVKKVGYFFKITWWIYFQIMVFIKAIRLRILNKYEFDVIYGYEIHGVPISKLLSIIWKIPLVARFQGTSYSAAWQGKSFRKVRAWQHFLAYKISSNLTIMTNDGTQGDRVLKELNVDLGRLRFWMNGVVWEQYMVLPARQEAKKNLKICADYILVSICRLEGWKRVERSVKALPSVIEIFNNTILIIVGNGSERAKLEQLSSELGVNMHVRFEGAVPHKVIPEYLSAADIFLSFYDWSNVGNPLLEAMMAGKCIVTLNNGDTSQFIKNGYNGVLLEYDELSTLPNVITKLLSDLNLREYLGNNARKFAEENFWTWEERINAEISEVTGLLHSSKE